MDVKTGPCICGGPEKVKTAADGSQYIERCPLYVKVSGTNPNTGEHVDEHRCAIAWMPMLLIENSQMQRQTGAAVESFRNETVKRQDVALRIALADRAPKGQLIEARIVEANDDAD